MLPDLSYAEACEVPEFFGPWFDGPSWQAWRVLDKAIFGEALTPDELAIFTELTGRAEAPSNPVAECWVIAGRRSGKDIKSASIVAYIATFLNAKANFQQFLTPGETAGVQLLAVDRGQAAICLGYLKAMFLQPALAAMVAKEAPDGLLLTNGLSIEITTNDKRRVRGRTVVACVFDEVAFWMSSDGNSVNPDTEIYNACKPAMATIPGAMLIGISSPYAKRGLLWNKFRKHYGQTDPSILVVKAPTWRMNPTLSRDHGVIARAFEDDQQAAAAEYGAEFRSDVSGFLDFDAVAACTDRGIRERAPIPPIPSLPNSRVQYFGFADPSGGSSDSMTLGIAHPDGGTAILDLAREIRPPFDPAEATRQLSETLKAYGLTQVTGDRYAAQWVVSAFAQNGVEYIHTTRSRSEIYLELLPAINAGACRLLDLPKLTTQLTSLERRTSRSGRDSVDHPPGAHDDLANAAAGALVLAAAEPVDLSGGVFSLRFNNRTGFSLAGGPRHKPVAELSDEEFEARFGMPEAAS